MPVKTGSGNKWIRLDKTLEVLHSRWLYGVDSQVCIFKDNKPRVSISLPSIAKETKLVIGWNFLSLGRPNPKISVLLGKLRHAFFENVFTVLNNAEAPKLEIFEWNYWKIFWKILLVSYVACYPSFGSLM